MIKLSLEVSFKRTEKTLHSNPLTDDFKEVHLATGNLLWIIPALKCFGHENGGD